MHRPQKLVMLAGLWIKIWEELVAAFEVSEPHREGADAVCR